MRPAGEKRPNLKVVAVQTQSGPDKCTGWCGQEQGYWEAPGAEGAILGGPEVQGVHNTQDAKAEVQDTQSEWDGCTPSGHRLYWSGVSSFFADVRVCEDFIPAPIFDKILNNLLI